MPTLQELYHTAFRSRVFQLVAWGYGDARAGGLIDRNTDETSITGHIAEAIADRLTDPATDERYWRFDVQDDPPERTQGRTGRGRRRADLIISSKEANLRPRYVFEAKRLGKGNPVGRYIGKAGLELFCSGVYARECPEAGMLGYIQSHDCGHWLQRVVGACHTQRTKLCLNSGPDPINVIPDLPNCLISNHSRPGGSSLRVSHIMLDCG